MDENTGETIIEQTINALIWIIGMSAFSAIAKTVLRGIMKKKLVRDLSKLVNNLKKLGLSDELISEFAKNFGNSGLDWLRQARGLGASADVLRELSKLDGFEGSMDEILELIKGSSRNADDVAECIIKYGDEAVDAICSYGKDALDAVGKYGDNALESIKRYGQEAVDAIGKYGDEAVDVIGKYGDDAVDGFKDGKTPAEVEKEFGGSSGFGPLENINIDDKQLGTKWGKHRYDYPDLDNFEEYKQLANNVFSDPDKIIWDSVNQEYLYIKGSDLLRVQPSGNFVSLYPGAESGRVLKAIENGGMIWEK